MFQGLFSSALTTTIPRVTWGCYLQSTPLLQHRIYPPPTTQSTPLLQHMMGWGAPSPKEHTKAHPIHGEKMWWEDEILKWICCWNFISRRSSSTLTYFQHLKVKYQLVLDNSVLQSVIVFMSHTYILNTLYIIDTSHSMFVIHIPLLLVDEWASTQFKTSDPQLFNFQVSPWDLSTCRKYWSRRALGGVVDPSQLCLPFKLTNLL